MAVSETTQRSAARRADSARITSSKWSYPTSSSPSTISLRLRGSAPRVRM